MTGHHSTLLDDYGRNLPRREFTSCLARDQMAPSDTGGCFSLAMIEDNRNTGIR
jgi:hypothetical protein